MFDGFAEEAGLVATDPFGIDFAPPDVAVDRRKGPIRRRGDKPVLYGIEPTVSLASHQVFFIANGVLPEAALPDALLAFAFFGT